MSEEFGTCFCCQVQVRLRSVFKLPARTYYRLRLWFLLDLQSSPTVLPSLLSHAVETRSSPSETHYSLYGRCRGTASQYVSGGDGGNRTLVQHAFALKGLQQFFTTITI